MTQIPTYRDFRPISKLPERRVAGLLLLEQRDGTPFALLQGKDIRRMHVSSLPRREGYWTRAKFWPESNTRRRVQLAMWLELVCPPRRPSASAAKMAGALEEETAETQMKELD